MIGHIVDTFVLAFGLVPTAAGIRVTVIQTVPRTHTHTHTLIHTHIYTHTYSYSNTYSQHNWTHAPHILLACGLVPTAALFFDGGLGITVCQTVSRTHTHTHTLIIHINTHTHTHTHIFSYEKLPVRLLLDLPLVARNESWCYSCLCLSLFNNLFRGNKVGSAQVLRIDLVLANGQYCFSSSISMLAVSHVCVIHSFNSCLWWINRKHTHTHTHTHSTIDTRSRHICIGFRACPNGFQ